MRVDARLGRFGIRDGLGSRCAGRVVRGWRGATPQRGALRAGFFTLTLETECLCAVSPASLDLDARDCIVIVTKNIFQTARGLPPYVHALLVGVIRLASVFGNILFRAEDLALNFVGGLPEIMMFKGTAFHRSAMSDGVVEHSLVADGTGPLPCLARITVLYSTDI
jgi:hypothetical protein